LTPKQIKEIKTRVVDVEIAEDNAILDEKAAIICVL